MIVIIYGPATTGDLETIQTSCISNQLQLYVKICYTFETFELWQKKVPKPVSARAIPSQQPVVALRVAIIVER
ncbi:MAG: hypothetical protein AAF633_25490, partial [Chloroflexota bacterium]